MDFANRLKKELTEGIVRSLLVDAGYRTVDFGIESQLREVECLKIEEYLKLNFPPALRLMPDLVVMNREQTTRYFVEIKYRNGWSLDVILGLEDQVKNLDQLVLIYVNGNPPEDRINKRLPSLNIRCCELKVTPNGYLFRGLDNDWKPVTHLRQDEKQWWGMNLLQNIFTDFHERAEAKTIATAVDAIKFLFTPSTLRGEAENS